MTPRDKAQILVVDDHPIMRHGIARLIDREPDLAVCAEAASADEALAAIAKTQPSLALVDLSLKGRPGLELIKEIQARYPQTIVLVLSMHDETIWAERSLAAGAVGYIMKQEDPRRVITAIRRALVGEMTLSQQVSAKLMKRVTSKRKTGERKLLEILGDRELEVLHLIGEGKTTKQIAADLNISLKTVEAHREHIKQKLELSTAAELLRYAVIRTFSDG